MLDDLFYADNLKAAGDAALRPPPVPKQAAGFSAWKTTTAAPRGVVAGGAQSGGFFADTLAAFGQALGGTGTASAQGMFSTQTDAERQQSEQQAQKIRAEGLDFSSSTGDNLRGFARFLAPDPETAHTAERLVFDLSRVMTKAVGYSVAGGGPLAGAVLTGADEGMAVADDLKQAGVDLGTRTAVGGVVGLATAAGVALPVAGNTLAQTAGLVAVGGPLSFMAQQQAVRSILQAADYSKLAEQYDPLDPVGLAVSTLVPAGFGAWGLRAAKARAATSAKAAEAQAARDFTQGPIPSEETAIARAAREVTQEHIDAARVMLDAENRRSTSPFKADDARTADAHEAALTKAIDQMAAGERVAVDDMAPRITPEVRAANFKEWFGDSKVVDEAGAPLVMYHGTAADFSTFSLQRSAAEGTVGRAVYLSPSPNYAARFAEGAATGSNASASVMSVFVSARRVLDLMRDEVTAADVAALKKAGALPDTFSAEGATLTHAQLYKFMVDRIGTQAVGDAYKSAGWDAVRFSEAFGGDAVAVFRPEQVKSAIGNSGRFDPNSASLTDSPIADWQSSVNAAIREMRQAVEAMKPKEPPRAAEPAPKPTAAEPAPSAPATPARAAAPAAGSDGARATGASAKAGLVDDAAATARVEQVKAEAPDLMVQLDGMDAPMRVDELLAAVKAEADDMLLDGELMQVAAECALRAGV